MGDMITMDDIYANCQTATDAQLSANGSIFCPPVVDNLLRCWGRTDAGARASLPCWDILQEEMASLSRRHLNRLTVPSDAVAFRDCDVTGRWVSGNWTNYSLCISSIEQLEQASGDLLLLTHVTFFGSLLSLLCLGASLFIFCYFRCLQCSRLSVHKNLIISLMLCNVIMMVISEPVITQRTGANYRHVDWLCKAVLAVQMYARLASVMWMWNEGFFLHSRITVSIFDAKAPFKFLHLMGWGVPALFVSVWTTLTHRALLDRHCWQGYARHHLAWVIVAPMIAALAINLLFMMNILRILVTRLRNNTALEIEKIRKAIKATAILFPLLGLTNLLFFIRPPDHSHWYQAYLLTNSLLHSSQGVFVSVLYCFVNTEVRMAVRRCYMRAAAVRGSTGRLATRRWTRSIGSRNTSSMLVAHSERLGAGPTATRHGHRSPVGGLLAASSTAGGGRRPAAGNTGETKI